MAFGREPRLTSDGGTTGHSNNYTCRQSQDSAIIASANPPHWMRQLEEKYQRLHAKIVNQAAKFSDARFNAINNNFSNNYHRSFSSTFHNARGSAGGGGGGTAARPVVTRRGNSLPATTGVDDKCGELRKNSHNNVFAAHVNNGNNNLSSCVAGSNTLDDVSGDRPRSKFLKTEVLHRQTTEKDPKLTDERSFPDNNIGNANYFQSFNGTTISSHRLSRERRASSATRKTREGPLYRKGSEDGEKNNLSQTAPSPQQSNHALIKSVAPSLANAVRSNDEAATNEAEIYSGDDPVRATLAKTRDAIALLNYNNNSNASSAFSSSQNQKGCGTQPPPPPPPPLPLQANRSRTAGRSSTGSGVIGSRPKSPRRRLLEQNLSTLDPTRKASEQFFDNQLKEGVNTSAVDFLPSGADLSGESYYNNNNNSSGVFVGGDIPEKVTCFIFEKEDSGALNTPRPSDTHTRASSSLALTRLSSAVNSNQLSRASSSKRGQVRVPYPYGNFDEDDGELVQTKQREDENSEFFTRRNRALDSNKETIVKQYGDVIQCNCGFKGVNNNLYDSNSIVYGHSNDVSFYHDDDDNYEENDEGYIYVDDGDDSDCDGSDDSGSVSIVFGECLAGDPNNMDAGRGRIKRSSSRGIRTSGGALGGQNQQALPRSGRHHKSCPAYFWESARPRNAHDNDEDQGEDDEEECGKQGEDVDTRKGNPRKSRVCRKNRKGGANKRDRRGIKSQMSRRNHSKEHLNSYQPHEDETVETSQRDVLNGVNRSIDNQDQDRGKHHVHNNNHTQMHNGNHPKPRQDGNISPVQGTVLPLTARAVEEGRMRVFARMSLEARHAVDETLREMEREEEERREMEIAEEVEVPRVAVDPQQRDACDGSHKPGEAMSYFESTGELSVMNNASGTRGSRVDVEREFTTGDDAWSGRDVQKTRGGEGVGSSGGDSQASVASGSQQDNFYALGKSKLSNTNKSLHPSFAQQDQMTHYSTTSSALRRSIRMGPPKATSRRLPHLSEHHSPQQTLELPNPHARLPGINSKSRPPLSYRETTFEITPPDFDIRFHHIITCNTGDRETPPPDIRQQSIEKCQHWLVRYNPRQSHNLK